MLDPHVLRRYDFREGCSILLSDGQSWPLPGPDEQPPPPSNYHDLLNLLIDGDRPEETLRAELALGIYLVAHAYALPPLILGSLFDFPEDDPALGRFQDDLHAAALLHLNASAPPIIGPEPGPGPRPARLSTPQRAARRFFGLGRLLMPLGA